MEILKFERTLVGQFVILRKVEVDDAEAIYKWRSGPSGIYLRKPNNYSVESQISWINSRDDNEINYIIIDKKTGDKVGTIGIYDANVQDRVTNVGRLLLDEAYLRKSTPYGLEALLLTYSYVFEVLLFRKITGEILAVNANMVKLQKLLGMTEEGYLRKHVYLNNDYYDIHIYSLFNHGYEKITKRKIAFLLSNFL